MHLVRYRSRDDSVPAVGILDGGVVVALGQVPTMASLLRHRVTDIRSMCEAGRRQPIEDVELLVPVDGRTEVWAAGVTYRRSMLARVEESISSPDIYDLVYGADRPELFFKSAAWRVVTSGEQIAIRADSEINVPEPELAVLANQFGEIVGYTVCNDVSSRSIEGENPLYLPQAKVYLGSCALSQMVRPSWLVPDPYALAISMQITRQEVTVWQGSANTSALHRRIEDLLAALFLADDFPDGVVLSTGTCLVPELPFSLTEGDVVQIVVPDVGSLKNPVVCGKSAMGWLAERAKKGATYEGESEEARSDACRPDAREEDASS